MTTLQEIDLDAFAGNVRGLRARVAPAALMLVVKDDAYGHGLAPVVSRAVDEGVGWIGAFDVETGLGVRAAAGDTVRVFVWQLLSSAEIGAAVDARLDIGVGTAALLEDVAALAAAQPGSAVRVHLKVDTGLHRNGVRPEEWGPFVARAAQLEADGAIEVIGIWSHLAEASDEEDDAARAVFDAAVDEARLAGLRPPLRHLAASAAAVARPGFRYDMVRIGAFCYGIRPAGGPAEADLAIRPIARVTASVVAVDEAAGVAVLSAGALDGLPSTLAGTVTVSTPGGRRALVRVGDQDSAVALWPGATRGDAVTLYGPDGAPSATDLAEAIGTIGEEVALRVGTCASERIFVA